MTRTLSQGVRWLIRAGVGLAANIVLLTLWVDYVNIPAWLAIVPNWVILSLSMYAVTDRWVFKELRSPHGLREHATRFVGSESIMTASKAVNYLIYVALLGIVDYRLAWIIGAGVTVVLTFAGNRWWWQRGHSTST